MSARLIPPAEYGLLALDHGRLFKANREAPCLALQDGQTPYLLGGTGAIVGGRLVSVAADAAIELESALVPGTDYAVYLTIDGRRICSPNFSAPTGYTTANSVRIGGFHYAPGGNGKLVSAVGYGDGSHLSRGTTDTRIATTAFYFTPPGGSSTLKAAVAAGTALPAQTVPQDKWALYRLSIVADGTITVTPAADNATTGYSSEALAIAALPALPALSAAVGYVTVQTKTGTTFVAATDGLAGGSSGNIAATTNYYSESANGPQINPYSIWDLRFRPRCPDPRGMALVGGSVWFDIYLTNTATDLNGSSKLGQTIADGASLPKIPAMFGGNGSTAYGAFRWYQAVEIARSLGKDIPSISEYIEAAFGIQERTSCGSDPVTTQWDAARTSMWGLTQAAGVMLIWALEMGQLVSGADYATAIAFGWKDSGDSRGQQYAQGTYGVSGALLGGFWVNDSVAGSRCAYWINPPWTSATSAGARCRSDHLVLP